MSGRLLTALALLSAVVTCRAPEPEDVPEPSRPAVPAEPPEPVRTGRVEGIVRYEGDLPPPQPVTMTGPRATACANAKGVYELSVVRGPQGGLANVFVSVEGVPAAQRPERTEGNAQTRTVVIDGCVIKPYVMDATLGDTLEIRNEDDHVYLCTIAGTSTAILKQGVLPGQSMTWPIDAPGGRRIDCTTDHPWLIAHLLIAQHPWHAVTTASGRFVIENVPAGRYTINSWHPTQREQSASVMVPAGGVGRVEIVYHARPTQPAGQPSAPSAPSVPGKTRTKRQQ